MAFVVVQETSFAGGHSSALTKDSWSQQLPRPSGSTQPSEASSFCHPVRRIERCILRCPLTMKAELTSRDGRLSGDYSRGQGCSSTCLLPLHLVGFHGSVSPEARAWLTIERKHDLYSQLIVGRDHGELAG